MRHLAKPLAFLIAGLISSTALWAQTPKKIVFVSPVDSVLPPAITSPSFLVPAGVAIGLSSAQGSITGTIWVADPDQNQVVAFPPTGSPTKFHTLTCPTAVRGCFGNSTWTLSMPTFVAAASNGNIWISDTGNDVVLQITPDGQVVQFAGIGPTGTVTGCFFGIGCSSNPNAGQANGQFFGPGPLAVDSSDNLYVADAAGDLGLGLDDGPNTGNIRIEKFDSSGKFLLSWGSFCLMDVTGNPLTETASGCNPFAPGAATLGDGQLALVTGIAVDKDSSVYVSDLINNRVQKFAQDGRFLLKWGGLPTGSANGQFKSPGGVAVDPDQTIYVTDLDNNRIQEFTTGGVFIGTTGSKGAGEAQFTGPGGIATMPLLAVVFACPVSHWVPDCVHGMVVSERPPNRRVQFLTGRADADLDGITDEIDLQPHAETNAFSNESLGFTTFGSILNPGGQIFAIYNALTPDRADEIRVRTETNSGPVPLSLSMCEVVVATVFPGAGANLSCSSLPHLSAELGPIRFQVTGSDGTEANGLLETGGSVSFNPNSSKILDNNGTIPVSIGNHTTTLMPGQTVFADSTAPTSTATTSFNRISHKWSLLLSATDNQRGSGVQSITYSLSGAQTGSATVPGNTHSLPILSQGVTEVKFFATDNAGNAENPPKTVTCEWTTNGLKCS